MKWRKIIFMGKKFMRDFSANRDLRVNTDNTNRELRHYYIRFPLDIRKLNRQICGFDAEGIPLNASYIDVKTSGTYYYPISIGQYGLAAFSRWLESGDTLYRDTFMRIAEWFALHAEEKEGEVWWWSDMPRAEYALFRPWKSAFAQSRGISVLLRAWQMTGNGKYADLASGALLPYAKDITEGGVSVDGKSGKGRFYEEYAADFPTRILDGHIFSLWGLYDYIRAVVSPDYASSRDLARRLFEEGIKGLETRLPEYDTGYWMRFGICDLPGYPNEDPCTMGYMRLIRAQLRITAALSGSALLNSYADKIDTYMNIRGISEMIKYKIRALRRLERL